MTNILEKMTARRLDFSLLSASDEMDTAAYNRSILIDVIDREKSIQGAMQELEDLISSSYDGSIQGAIRPTEAMLLALLLFYRPSIKKGVNDSISLLLFGLRSLIRLEAKIFAPLRSD